MLNKEKKKKLFDILIDFGFKKLKTDKHVYFNQFINLCNKHYYKCFNL